MYQIPLSNFFAFLFFYALWQKINQTNSILKGFIKIFDEVWTQDAERTAKLVMYSKACCSQPRCLCCSANWLRQKSYLPGPTGVVFSELHRLLRGTIENFVVAVVSPLEYIRVQHVETLRVGIQAVHRTD
jgi:hypothetical protein